MSHTIVEAAPVVDRKKVEELVEKLNAIAWDLTGRAAALIETPEPHRHVLRQQVEAVVGRGFAGDHDHKSFYKGSFIPGREVSAISLEVLRVFDVDAVVPGDNLITEGVDLGLLEEGDWMQVGEVLLERSHKAHRPCTTFRDRTSPEAFAAVSRGRYRGAVFFVREGGIIRIGDPIEIMRT